MIAPPAVVNTVELPAAVIPVSIHPSQIREVMGAEIRELMDTLAREEITPAGPLFTHYSSMTPERWDFVIGVPVASPVLGAGRMQAGSLPAAQVARTVYTGPYEGLPGAWGDFMQWVTAEGLRPTEELWESYLVGPDGGGDPATYQTELNRVLHAPAQG